MSTFLKLTLSAALLALSVSSAKAQTNTRLVIQGDTVYDKKTDLTWQRCSVGTRWNPTTQFCVGIKKVMTFDEANAAAWPGGWRMPTSDELQTLLRGKNADGLYIDSAAFPDAGDLPTSWYWSSTPNGASHGWFVDFFNGGTDNHGPQ
jgi:hypothetical protein